MYLARLVNLFLAIYMIDFIQQAVVVVCGGYLNTKHCINSGSDGLLLAYLIFLIQFIIIYYHNAGSCFFENSTDIKKLRKGLRRDA